MKKKLKVYVWGYDHPDGKRFLPLFVQFPEWSLSKEEEDVKTIMSARKVEAYIIFNKLTQKKEYEK